jgi:hypothetical protein
MRPISVTVGPGPGTSNPIRLDEWADAGVGVQVVVIGTVTSFTVQTSMDEGPDSLVNPIPLANMAWDTGLVPAGAVTGGTSISFGLGAAGIAVVPLWIRIVLTTGTGSVRMNVVQPDSVSA